MVSNVNTNSPQDAGQPFPSVQLANGLLQARAYLPDKDKGYYRGPRFDWSGMIGPVEYAGHKFFGPFRIPHNPQGNDDGVGPAEEFSMKQPLDYAEIKPGERFVKIGVGELVKPDDPEYREYPFYKPFKIADSPRWEIDSGKDWIEYRQVLHGPRGWGYEYVKRISLSKDKPVMMVSHRLTNIGTKTIDTTWYCHNFVNIDGYQIGPGYELNFPFEPAYPTAPNAQDIRTQGKLLTYVRPLPHNYGAPAELFNYHGVADARVMIWHTHAGAGIDIRLDQAPIKYAVWASSTVTCPEMFIRIHIVPGSNQTWEGRYAFLDKAGR